MPTCTQLRKSFTRYFAAQRKTKIATLIAAFMISVVVDILVNCYWDNGHWAEKEAISSAPVLLMMCGIFAYLDYKEEEKQLIHAGKFTGSDKCAVIVTIAFWEAVMFVCILSATMGISCPFDRLLNSAPCPSFTTASEAALTAAPMLARAIARPIGKPIFKFFKECCNKEPDMNRNIETPDIGTQLIKSTGSSATPPLRTIQ